MDARRFFQATGRIMFALLVMVWTAFIVMVLVACTPEQPLAEKGVHHVPGFEWRIVDRGELQAAYERYGMKTPHKARLEGFVGQTDDGRWVVYSTAPYRVDDQVATTLGHEVMHIVLGEYHD